MLDSFKDYKITLEYDISEHVSKDIKYCFIMIIKEALSNTAKHSNANVITIIIREHPVFYQLLIKDNGSHLKQRELGMGLENMKIRVKNLNGNISFEQSNGFQIFVSIPKSEKGGIN
jgi:signal transduction histidine kinase